MLHLRILAARKPVMTSRQLAKEPVFLEMTSQQKACVLHFVEDPDHDATAAILFAYNVTGRSAALRLAHDVFRRASVLRTLNLFFGVDDKERFLKELDKAIQDPHVSVARIRGMELYARAQGWITPGKGGRPPKGKAKAASRKFRVGEHVLMNDQECVVTAVDESGQPTEVEPAGAKRES